MTATDAAGYAIRSVVVTVLVIAFLAVLMLLVRTVTLQSVADDAASPDVSGEPGPAADESRPEVLQTETLAVAGIRCARPATSAEIEPFRVQADDTAPAASEIVVEVALVGTDGTRHQRQAVIVGEGAIREAAVPDSGDRNLYGSCVIMAIQADQRIIITGR